MRKNGVRVLCVMICSASLCSCGARKTQITLPFTETPVTPVTEEDTDTAYVSAYVPETTVPETTVPEPLTEESETTAVRVFMDGMNAWLKKLGTKNTFFTSPDGIAEKDHHTCIYDVTLISKAVLNDGFLRKVVSAKSFSFTGPSGEKRAYYNTNQLLRENTGCIGLKTGHTGLAGYCLAAAAER